jgi:hypothetical protein
MICWLIPIDLRLSANQISKKQTYQSSYCGFWKMKIDFCCRYEIATTRLAIGNETSQILTVIATVILILNERRPILIVIATVIETWSEIWNGIEILIGMIGETKSGNDPIWIQQSPTFRCGFRLCVAAVATDADARGLGEELSSRDDDHAWIRQPSFGLCTRKWNR